MHPVLAKIRSRGFWKIVFRPSEFVKERIASVSECKSLVRDNSVLFRGWDYPHYDTQNEPSVGLDYAEQSLDWQIHIEAWRMYQSGQFAHYLAAWEDWHEAQTLWGKGAVISPEAYLNITGAVYFMTEIYEFAARLAAKGVFGSECEISVALCNTKSRRLKTVPLDRVFLRNCTTSLEEIPRTTRLTVTELVGRSPELALDHVAWLFQRFNWDNAKPAMFQDDQRQLLEKRA